MFWQKSQNPDLIKKQSLFANGKLLLSGEYFVLDGALALALPTRLGQHMEVEVVPEKKSFLWWKSLDNQEKIWFEGRFLLPDALYMDGTDEVAGTRLQQILRIAKNLNLDFLNTPDGYAVTTRLDFQRDWGLGSSSTLVYNIARWAGVSPYKLQFSTFGGSGYDIACAGAGGPVFYKKRNKAEVYTKPASFSPAFKEQLYFVFLEKKQNSREGIKYYRDVYNPRPETIERISSIGRGMAECASLDEFEELVVEHEEIVSRALNLPCVKVLLFEDYWGEVKSLGAWGGDFVLATSRRSQEETTDYFCKKGFSTCLRYEDLIL